jgi:hypothetical protein
LIFATPKIKTKKLKKTSNSTIIFPGTDKGTISPNPTEEKVIVLKYKNSKNCRKNELSPVIDDLKLYESVIYKA